MARFHWLRSCDDCLFGRGLVLPASRGSDPVVRDDHRSCGGRPSSDLALMV